MSNCDPTRSSSCTSTRHRPLRKDDQRQLLRQGSGVEIDNAGGKAVCPQSFWALSAMHAVECCARCFRAPEPEVRFNAGLAPASESNMRSHGLRNVLCHSLLRATIGKNSSFLSTTRFCSPVEPLSHLSLPLKLGSHRDLGG